MILSHFPTLVSCLFIGSVGAWTNSLLDFPTILDFEFMPRELQEKAVLCEGLTTEKLRQKELGPVYAKKEVYPTGSCTAHKTQIDLRRCSATGAQDGPQDLSRGDCKHSEPCSPTVRMIQQSPFKNRVIFMLCI